MHKNKDFGIVSLYSSDREVFNENFSKRCRVLSVLQRALCCQQGALGAGYEPRQGEDNSPYVRVGGRGYSTG